MNVARTVRVIFTETGAVLQNTENGTAFSTNLVGAKIWQDLTKGVTKDEIVDRLCSEFNVASDMICRDMDEFLSGLEQKGLLQKDVSEAQ